MSTKDPLEAKKLSKCIVKNEMWRRIEEEVITEICVCAALHDNAYFHELINTGDAMLIEAVRGDFEWGSGLGYRETMSTVIDKIPGSNKIGNILMLVRRRLFSSQVQGSCQSEAEQLSSPTQMSPNCDEIGQVNLSQAVHSNTLNRHHHTAPSPKTLEQDSSSPQDNPIINSSNGSQNSQIQTSQSQHPHHTSTTLNSHPRNVSPQNTLEQNAAINHSHALIQDCQIQNSQFQIPPITSTTQNRYKQNFQSRNVYHSVSTLIPPPTKTNMKVRFRAVI